MGRFIRTKDGKLYDVINYGIDTAGSDHQKSIVEKNGKYYFEDWYSPNNLESYGDWWYTEIDVVMTSDKINDIVDEIVDIDSGWAALINRRVVAIYNYHDETELSRIASFDWDVLSNKVNVK